MELTTTHFEAASTEHGRPRAATWLSSLKVLLVLIVSVQGVGCACLPQECAPEGAPQPTFDKPDPLHKPHGHPPLEDPMIGMEPPHPRFHPVPAWDVFHPPVDFAAHPYGYDDGGSCELPFYLVPQTRERVEPEMTPATLPYPVSPNG